MTDSTKLSLQVDIGTGKYIYSIDYRDIAEKNVHLRQKTRLAADLLPEIRRAEGELNLASLRNSSQEALSWAGKDLVFLLVQCS